MNGGILCICFWYGGACRLWKGPGCDIGCDLGCDIGCDRGCDMGCDRGCDSGCDMGCDSGCERGCDMGWNCCCCCGCDPGCGRKDTPTEPVGCVGWLGRDPGFCRGCVLGSGTGLRAVCGCIGGLNAMDCCGKVVPGLRVFCGIFRGWLVG